MIDCMSDGKNMIIHLIVGLIKKKLNKNESISNFVLKSNLASLNAEVDKIDVEKLKTVHVDLSKLRNAVNNDLVKKTVYDKLVDTDKSELEIKFLILVALLIN